MQVKNNHILIDIGHFGTHFNEADIGGVKMAVDATYDGYRYLRRSGKVVSAPKGFDYYKPYNLEHQMSRVRVSKDDKVFFEDRAYGYAENHKLIRTASETGNTLYIIPYRALICAIKPDETIQMLNGKVLIKMRHDLMASDSGLSLPETVRQTDAYRYAEIVCVDENEGYTGYTMAPSLDFIHMGYKKQDLAVGDIVVLNKYSDFDLQSIFKEVTEHDELQKSFVVNRADIVCFKKKVEDEFEPYGLYVKLDAIQPESFWMEGMDKGVGSGAKSGSGFVTGVGSSIFGIEIGGKIFFRPKSDIIIEDKMYVNREWILLTN